MGAFLPAALLLPPQRFTVTVLPAGPNPVALLSSVANWLQSYPITVPLLDEAGEPLLLPMSDARHPYTGELRREAEAPGDQAVERIPLTLQGNVLLGELQRLSVPTDDGCLAPLSVGASLVTAEMPFQVRDASGAPYRIAPSARSRPQGAGLRG